MPTCETCVRFDRAAFAAATRGTGWAVSRGYRRGERLLRGDSGICRRGRAARRFLALIAPATFAGPEIVRLPEDSCSAWLPARPRDLLRPGALLGLARARWAGEHELACRLADSEDACRVLRVALRAVAAKLRKVARGPELGEREEEDRASCERALRDAAHNAGASLSPPLSSQDLLELLGRSGVRDALWQVDSDTRYRTGFRDGVRIATIPAGNAVDDLERLAEAEPALAGILKAEE